MTTGCWCCRITSARLSLRLRGLAITCGIRAKTRCLAPKLPTNTRHRIENSSPSRAFGGFWETAILRPDEAIRDWGQFRRHTVPVPGGLCGQRRILSVRPVYLWALKIWYPTSIECRHLTDYFTFKLECTSTRSASTTPAPSLTSPTSPTSAEETDARRKVIKNKIMAVGRMSRVFALLREESEKVSELKSVSGSSKLPYGTLASGSEGIKSAITGFDDARKSDIENERLPPDLVDASSEEGKALMSSGSSSNSGASSPTPTDEPDLALGAASPSASPALGDKALALDTAATPSAGSPSPSPSPTGSPYRRGHGRQASLGTTMTSPSTRRRGLEDTISLIQGVWDGKAPPVPGSGPAEGSIAEEAAPAPAPAA
ncbi:hypothetical protein C8R47DRAFT_798537 [Mycena vitilis]|nr:hypothetical protein C8R47DRAFT_798537 [Mycena vitilis]